MQGLNEFWQEVSEGDIHFRDNLQFELKAEFFINPHVKENTYKQDFYLFIPYTLQINSQTYSREQFYLDETNLIRYKTPQISLSQLIQEDNTESPLIRLKKDKKNIFIFQVIDELRLFGNIFKAAVRDRIRVLLLHLENQHPEMKFDVPEQVLLLCQEIKRCRQDFFALQNDYFLLYPSLSDLHDAFLETDEFVSTTIEYYLTTLLKLIRDAKIEDSKTTDEQLCLLITQEQQYRHEHHLLSKAPEDDPHAKESILYRLGLLNSFMLEALLLKSNRISLQEKHGNILGAIAAGIAMLIYMWLLWKSTAFVINSAPFVLLAVVLYVLKDRIKEGIKTLFYKQAFRWYPDYATQIENRAGTTIGKLNENFSFIDEQQLPDEVRKIRTTHFHEELPNLKRQETLIHYKREVTLYHPAPSSESRRRGLTIIFRFNLSRFLEKASNAIQPTLVLDPDSLEIIEQFLPKVYHLDIIIQNTYRKANQEAKVEIKKFRVVVDKFGIKRVEQVK